MSVLLEDEWFKDDPTATTAAPILAYLSELNDSNDEVDYRADDVTAESRPCGQPKELLFRGKAPRLRNGHRDKPPRLCIGHRGKAPHLHIGHRGKAPRLHIGHCWRRDAAQVTPAPVTSGSSKRPPCG